MADLDNLQRLVMTLLEEMGDACVVLDGDWRYLFVNRKAGEIFGRDPASLAGKHIWTEFPEGKGQAFHLAYEQAMKERRFVQVEAYYPPWDRWFENRIHPCGGGIAIFFNDVTERHRAEEDARRDAAARAQAETMAHLGFWQWDVAANRVTWSDELYRIYGLAPGEFRPTFEGYLERVHPRDRERVRETIERALRLREPATFDEWIVRPDGQVRRLHSWAAISGDSKAGLPEVMFGTCLDMTLLIEAQESLQKAQKMEAIGRLAAGVAHDFNNLLAIIQGASCMLQSPVADRKEAAEAIDGAIDRAAALTKQLLAVSRQQVLALGIHDVDQIVRDMSKLVARLLPQSIELRTELGGAGHVSADRTQLEQVVLNLVVNARDAMPAGGVLTVATRSMGEAVAIDVRDTGVGISPEVQTRIFEPFYTTKAQEGGTGLGLAMVYGIVTQCGGRIELESAPGAGTRFTILLPRSTAAIS